jgi:hypothetical protein
MHGLVDGFVRDWRQLYFLHGDGATGWSQYQALRDALRGASQSLGAALVMRSNGVAAHTVLEARLLRHLLSQSAGVAVTASAPATPAPPRGGAPRPRLERPVFIVAAPRSGSTLLYETLAVTPQLHTLGGETHWLEAVAGLRPGANGPTSNRLVASHCSPAVAARLHEAVLEALVDHRGTRPVQWPATVRLLEKTPKNALRIPFLLQLYPDAQFIFLWRDPRENISSMIDAWESDRWVTYPQLPGWEGPWSLLLPPGWSALRGQSMERITAWQWNVTNQIALTDLADLAPERWTSVEYAELLRDPEGTLRRLCDFIGIGFDLVLAARCAQPLPNSRYTHTPPAADKWRQRETQIMQIVPDVSASWNWLRSLRAIPLQTDNGVAR